MPHAPETVASIRAHSSGGNASRTIPCTAAVITPPPKPWSPRPAIRIAMLGADAHVPVPRTRTPDATSSVAWVPLRRRTIRLPALPRIDETAYTVEAHA